MHAYKLLFSSQRQRVSVSLKTLLCCHRRHWSATLTTRLLLLNALQTSTMTFSNKTLRLRHAPIVSAAVSCQTLVTLELCMVLSHRFLCVLLLLFLMPRARPSHLKYCFVTIILLEQLVGVFSLSMAATASRLFDSAQLKNSVFFRLFARQITNQMPIIMIVFDMNVLKSGEIWRTAGWLNKVRPDILVCVWWV